MTTLEIFIIIICKGQLRLPQVSVLREIYCCRRYVMNHLKRRHAEEYL